MPPIVDNLKLQETLGLEALVISNEPADLKAFLDTLDEKKLGYLRLIVQAQQDARQAVAEANYYRFHLRFAAAGLLLFGLTFSGLGALLFFKFPNAARALFTSPLAISTLTGAAGMGLFNVFDWGKMFFLDKWYFGKEQEDGKA